MSATVADHVLTPRRELATLLALGAVQFTHIVDFMIMMPLGSQLMREFGISPAQFTYLVASYAVSAAISGFAGGFFLDRYDRKRALLTFYAGFATATLACGLAPSHHTLLIARCAAGAFGGLCGSLITAMVGDIIPPHRRGRAMGTVMSAFPVASVLGVPIGLVLAGRFGWHAAFFFLAGCSTATFATAGIVLPHLRTALRHHAPWKQMRAIVTHPIHLRAFALGATLIMAGACLVPFVAPSLIANVGLTESQLPWAYASGGICTFISMPLIGRLSDRVDKLAVLAWMTAAAIVVTLVFTRLPTASLAGVCALMALFMVTMSGRFTPAMAMVTNAVEARYRGGFMSVNSALQQAASGVASLIAGLFITAAPSGRLEGFPSLSYVSVGFFVLAVLLAAQLRMAAPHVSAPAGKPIPAIPPEIAA